MQRTLDLPAPACAELPPGPSLPPVLQILRWLLRPIPFMEECRDRFGDWFTLRFPGQPPFVFTSDPRAVREIFGSDSTSMQASQANNVLRPLLGDYSLLLLEGPLHADTKRLMLPAFHGERMQAYALAVRRIAQQSLRSWTPGRVFPLHAEMQRITLETILQAVLGLESGPEMEKLKGLVTTLLNKVANPLRLLMVNKQGRIRLLRLQSLLGPLSPWGQTERLIRQVDQILYAQIERSRMADLEEREDILALIMLARDEQGRTLNQRELRDQLMTLLVAGHETTATALSWTFCRLLENPNALKRAQQEVEEISGGGELEAAHIPRLQFLDACLRESMRLTPVIPIIGRVLQRTVQVGDRRLSAGSVVAPCLYLTHRNPSVWEQPDEFRPERFLNSRPKAWEFFPFGGGNRYCLGASFALYEMKIVLAEILSSAELELTPGYRARVVRRSVTLAPSGRLPVRLLHRRG